MSLLPLQAAQLHHSERDAIADVDIHAAGHHLGSAVAAEAVPALKMKKNSPTFTSMFSRMRQFDFSDFPLSVHGYSEWAA